MAKSKKEKGICARKGFVWAYMCLIDWEDEAGFNAAGNHINYSIEGLKQTRPCVENCGIVKVKIEFVKTIQEYRNQKSNGKKKKENPTQKVS